MAPATFYTVSGPRGVYYAVRNHHTGKVWTERTEHAALEQANEEKLAIVASEEINHVHLLDLMIAQGLSSQAASHSEAATRSSDAPRRGGFSRFLKRFSRDAHRTPSGGDPPK